MPSCQDQQEPQRGVRGASNRRFTFSDLNLSKGFGPEESGRFSRLLMMILRKGQGIHKDNFITVFDGPGIRHPEQ